MKNKNTRSNWLDSTIGFFSPEAGFRRMQYRRAQQQVRLYEAATLGRRGNFDARSTSANTEIGPALHRVRDRVREQVRNNPYATKAVSELESAIVGTGIMSTLNVAGSKGALQDRIRGLYRDWAESTDCDVDGLHNFYGLQAIMARAITEGGECLVVRRWRSKSDGYRIPVPFQIQILEGDFIDTVKDITLDNGGFIRQGVEFDKQGRRVAYWLFNQHPGDHFLVNIKAGRVSERVDAKDVLHLFRADRSGQVRGISWGAPCVIRLQDLDAYEDAQLLRQRIAASFAMFVRDIEMPDSVVAAEAQFPEKLEAGAIEILPPGKMIEFPNLPIVQNDGHAERVLRSIAAGWQVPYEVLTGDYSHVNYSSYRAAMISYKRNVAKWQWLMIIPRGIVPVQRWFIEACDVALGLPITSAMVQAIHTTPRFELVDPTKEIPAIATAIRSGLQTMPEAIREQGYDPEEQLAEIAEFNKKLDAAGVILDTDPRKVMKAGILQQPTAEELSPSQGDGAKSSN